MPTFQYTAMDSGGKEKKGSIEAATEDAAASKLKEQNLFITSIKAGKGAGKNDKTVPGAAAGTGNQKKQSIFNMSLGSTTIKTKDLTILTRQLAILLDAGLPLIRSLRTLEKQSTNPAIKKVLNLTANSVEGGSTFSEALAQNPKSFDKLFLNMVRAGEAAGKLELILNRLAMFMEKAAKIAGKVKSAMIYPVVVLIIAGGITGGLMVFIVPKFQKIFSELLGDTPLPLITQFVMKGSDILQHNILGVAIVIGLLVAVYKVASKTKQGRYGIDWALYRAPLVGAIVSKSSISKFARTLGTLMGSGVPVLNALSIVRDTAGNEVVSNAVQQVHDAVKEGEGMAAPLASTKIFPEMVISMIEVGEETGKLPEMLEKIADTYDEEVDNAVGALTSMIEPLMIVGLAVIVGTIVLAMFAPMISIIEKLGSTN